MGDNILDEAQTFTYKHFKGSLKNDYKIDSNLAVLVSHMNTTWLELTKLDFNLTQAIHIEDLKHMSR